MNRYWPLLLLLASVWGASYLFIKVAVDGGFEPAPLMGTRAAIAAAILLAYVVRRLGRAAALEHLRASWRRWAVLGVVGNAVPFWLVAWGVGVTPGPVLAAGVMVAAAASLLPLALVQAPTRVPDGDALLSLLALAVLGTGLAQLVMYRLIDLVGARKMSLVTYLMPAFALLYGAAVLDEPVTAAVLGGLALILTGVALGSGTLRARGRAVAGARG